MRHAWRRVFDEARRPVTDADELDAIARRATPQTSIAELGYGLEAQNVLDQMGIHRVRDLLAVDRVRFRYLKGVGDKIRREIRARAKRLAQLRPDLVPGGVTLLEGEGGGLVSIDDLAAHLLPRRPLGDDRPEERALAIWLGLDDGVSTPATHQTERLQPRAQRGQGAIGPGLHPTEDEPKSAQPTQDDPSHPTSQPPPPFWPALGEAARDCDLARGRLTDALMKARERWPKSPRLTEVREQLAALLATHGGAMTAREAASGLLAAHGSLERVEAERLRLAGAVACAAVEAEAGLAGPRFLVFEAPRETLIALDPATADWALALGRAADSLALADPIRSPQRALESLQSVPPPEAAVPPAHSRLLKLAAAASARAALSSRGEIYPSGMAPAQALSLAAGALSGPAALTVEMISERVLGRYPEAAPLPAPPALDALLADAGLDLVWRPDRPEGPAYERTGFKGQTLGSSTAWQRVDTFLTGAAEPPTPEIAAARQLEVKLLSARRAGGFLALGCPLRLTQPVQAELLRRFDLRSLSLDTLLVRAMREQAGLLKVSWPLVSRADAAGPGSADWSRLLQLVNRALPGVRERILAEPDTLLLTDLGLLGRYRLQGLLSDLQDAVSRPVRLPARHRGPDTGGPPLALRRHPGPARAGPGPSRAILPPVPAAFGSGLSAPLFRGRRQPPRVGWTLRPRPQPALAHPTQRRRGHGPARTLARGGSGSGDVAARFQRGF